MGKVKFTTTFDEDLLKKVKIQAVKEGRSVSDLLEEITTKYLESNEQE